MKIVTLSSEYELSLLRKAQDGDEDAYNTLRKQYELLIGSLVTNKIPTYDPADVKQELELAFLEAVMKFDFSKNVKFITYLTNMLNYRISAIIKEMKRFKRCIAYERMDPILETTTVDLYSTEHSKFFEGHLVPSPEAEAAFEDVDLMNSLSSLNETEIQVATLIVEGYKNKEIAQILGVRPWRISDIRQNLNKKLRRSDGIRKLSF